MPSSNAFFVRECERYVPTGRGVSPWNGLTLGGVAMAGLVVHLMEQLPALAPMHCARLTIDILGTPPIEPLETTSEIVREGRRVQLLAAELRSGGRSWARATMLRVREEATPATREAPLTRAFPGDTAEREQHALGEMIVMESAARVPGRGARWVKFAHPVVAGTELSPLERVAMIADFGSGISPPFSTREWTFANLDITLHLSRLPRGDWLLNDATSETGGNGVGQAFGQIGDRDGMIGRSGQTVFLARR